MTKTSKTKRAATPVQRKASGRKSAPKASSPVTQMKKTAMQVLAGAAVGAVRAIIPPLEKAARTGAEAAGIEKKSDGTRGKAKR